MYPIISSIGRFKSISPGRMPGKAAYSKSGTAHGCAGTQPHGHTYSRANSNPYAKPLLESTARHFAVAEISADKAYLSHSNVDVAASLGVAPFIPFKANTFPVSDNSNWAKMYHYFMFNREAFLAHYHRRSNVETVFSMIKGKFGDAIRSKDDTAQVNEVLCKVLCHNICVLVQSIHELGIDPAFPSMTVKAVA